MACPLLVLCLNVFDIDFAHFCRSFGAFACTFASVAFAALLLFLLLLLLLVLLPSLLLLL